MPPEVSGLLYTLCFEYNIEQEPRTNTRCQKKLRASSNGTCRLLNGNVTLVVAEEVAQQGRPMMSLVCQHSCTPQLLIAGLRVTEYT